MENLQIFIDTHVWKQAEWGLSGSVGDTDTQLGPVTISRSLRVSSSLNSFTLQLLSYKAYL